MQANNFCVIWLTLVILVGASETTVRAACPGGTCYVDDNCTPPTDGTSGDPDYERIGEQATRVCQNVDSRYTDRFLQAEEEARKLIPSQDAEGISGCCKHLR